MLNTNGRSGSQWSANISCIYNFDVVLIFCVNNMGYHFPLGVDGILITRFEEDIDMFVRVFDKNWEGYAPDVFWGGHVLVSKLWRWHECIVVLSACRSHLCFRWQRETSWWYQKRPRKTSRENWHMGPLKNHVNKWFNAKLHRVDAESIKEHLDWK